jgi:hypothetical protein
MYKSLKEATSINNSWNKIVEWNGLRIATVRWHNGREWKLLDNEDFETISARDYHPKAEFHTQEELWQYIKANIPV